MGRAAFPLRASVAAATALLMFGVLSGCRGGSVGQDPESREVSMTVSNSPTASVSQGSGFDPEGPVSPAFTDLQKEQQRLLAKQLADELSRAAAEGRKEFTVPPGDYRFSANSGYAISGLNGMHILCSGVTFWFERPSASLLADPAGLSLRECSDVVIEGLTVDFDPPLFIQGKVSAFDISAGTIDFTVDDGFPLPGNFTGQILLYKADGTIMPQGVLYQSGVQDLGGRSLRVSVQGAFGTGNQSPALQEAFGRRVVLESGDYAALPFRRGKAVFLDHCTRVTLKDVSVYASPGMGILEGFGDANVFDGVRITRRPGTRRLLSCMADTFHSYSDFTGPQIRNCEFAYNCDDFINIHGFFGIVAERLAPDRYAVGTMAGEELVPGGRLDFYGKYLIDGQGSAVITEAVRAPGYDAALLAAVREMKTHEHAGMATYLVTLDHDVTADRKSLVDINSNNASGFLIENNLFHSSMGRSVLLSGAHDGTVRNNVFRSMNGGINISMESFYSMEGQFPENISILDNRFEDILGYVAPAPQDQPVQGFIYVGMVPSANFLRSVIRDRNIVISGNTIEHPPMTPILAAYAENLTVTDNRIIRPYFITSLLGRLPGMNYYKTDPSTLVYVSTSKDITVFGNTSDSDGTAEFSYDYCVNVSTKVKP